MLTRRDCATRLRRWQLVLATLLAVVPAQAQDDPLPSWNDGTAKKAIVEFRGGNHPGGQPDLRTAGRADRHLRPGRHALGRTPDVQPGDLLPGAGPGTGCREAGTQGGRALQDRADRRPRGDRQAADARTREDPRRHADRDDNRSVQRRGCEVDRGRQGPALEAPLYRADLPAHAGGSRLPARQRLQDLHRDRRRPGFRACLLRGNLRDSAGASGRDRRRNDLQLRQGRQADPDQGAEASAERQRCRQARRHPSDDRAPSGDGIRQFDRRQADAGIYHGRQRSAARHAGAARRCRARIRLWPGAGPARHQGRRIHPGTVRRSHEEWLGGHQHEEGLGKDFRP